MEVHAVVTPIGSVTTVRNSTITNIITLRCINGSNVVIVDMWNIFMFVFDDGYCVLRNCWYMLCLVDCC